MKNAIILSGLDIYNTDQKVYSHNNIFDFTINSILCPSSAIALLYTVTIASEQLAKPFPSNSS